MIIHHSQESSKCKASSIIVEIELISSRGYKNEKTNCHEFMRHLAKLGYDSHTISVLYLTEHGRPQSRYGCRIQAQLEFCSITIQS